MTSLRIWLASTACFGLYKFAHSFVALWVNSDFILEQSPFIVLLLIAFINMTRTNDMFLAAYGLYQDIWAPITEACINLGLSILLGYFYGLTGILFGVLISMLLIVFGWKPFFLYRYGFKEGVREYVVRYLKYITLIVIAYICISLFADKWFTVPINSYRIWLSYALQISLLYAIFSLLLFMLVDKSSRRWLVRCVMILKNKKI